ncbi:T9SS type B sorting domain-containing protein [Aureivirga sp. CE67]|uniref:T9SS type B sorting domain-containing protein n=1 Tax=Aureivirga sp. CE67 TaxID=1788983 RepID=UPI0018CB63B6|nr:T9SS type B sorting domain-containing protein [Aureivirga sp. CE67]
MNNKIIIKLLFLFVFSNVFSQKIEINADSSPNNYELLSLEELVEQVFIDGDCVDINSISTVVNPDYGPNQPQKKNYGYFQRPDGVDFPFEDGIILTTGNAYRVGNQTFYPNSEGGGDWESVSDVDLEKLIENPNIKIKNATSFEFDFIAPSESTSFRYIFGSNEYSNNSFPCGNFADTFAFILSGDDIPNSMFYNHDSKASTPDIEVDLGGINIALVPETNIPVKVTTIHDKTCANSSPGFGVDSNIDYYTTEYQSLNTGGTTVPMTAEINGLTPGNTYHLKLVVADASDYAYDSFVMLEGGGFILKKPEIEEITKFACEGESYIIGGDDLNADGTYSWEKYDEGTDTWEEVPASMQPTIEVFENGKYRVNYLYNDICKESNEITIHFVPEIEIEEDVTDYVVCNHELDFTFDLTTKHDEISGANDPADVYITYFESEDAMLDPANAITEFNVTSATPVTIWAKASHISGNGTVDCFKTATFDLVLIQSDIATVIPPIIGCDTVSPTNPEGEEMFDLMNAQTMTDLLNGADETDFFISYYLEETLENEILNPNTFINTSNPQTVFINVVPKPGSGIVIDALCPSVVPLELQVSEIPEANLPDAASLFLCEDVTEFDLEALKEEINDSEDVAILFSSAGNPITTPMYAATDGEEIVAEVIDNISGCSNTVTFNIQVGVLPTVAVIDPIVICDDNGDDLIRWNLPNLTTELTNGDLYDVTYHTGIPDDSNKINYPNSYLSGSKTLHFELTDKVTGCKNQGTFDIEVLPSPDLENKYDYYSCDNIPYDNQALFDLITIKDDILSGTTGLTAEFYESIVYNNTTAQFEPQGLITTVADYLSGTKTIYIVVEDAVGGCTNRADVSLNVENIPINLDITDYILCDDNYDGFVSFDLTTKQNEVLTVSSTAFTIKYFNNETDANADTNEIPVADLANFTNEFATNDEVWVRVETENPIGEICSAFTKFNLIVNPLPEIHIVTNLESCADIDGFGTYDLQDANADLLQGQTDIEITYYQTEDAAVAGDETSDLFIANFAEYKINEGDSNNVYTRLRNTNTDCFAVNKIGLVINPLPTLPAEDLLIYSCDAPIFDGFATFDLSTLETAVIGINENVINLGFFEGLAPNSTEIPTTAPIADIVNYNSETKKVYAFLQNQETLCGITVEIDLIVESVPFMEIPNLENCDEDFDGYSLFNLTDVEPTVFALEVDVTNYTFQYFESEDDALVNVNELSGDAIVNYQNPEVNVSQIWIKANSTLVECSRISSFYVITHPKPLINEVENLQGCDDGDGSVPFDLTLANEQILNSQLGITITYYTDLNEANIGDETSSAFITNPTTFENTVTPIQTIYAHLKNDVTGCTSVTPFNIQVNPQPTIPDVYDFIVCDDDINDGITSIYLSNADNYHTFNTPGYSVTYYHQESEAISGTNAIVSPYINNTQPNTFEVYVRIENNFTHCFDITTMNVEITNSPASTNPTPLEVCDQNNDGFVEFDLTLKNSEITYALGQVSVTYFEELIDAEELVFENAIDTPENYANIDINNQTVYALVRNEITGCTDIVSLELIVNTTPTVEEVETIEKCDDTTADGFTAFDLTIRENEIVAETGINFEYYYTEDAAKEGDVTNTEVGTGYITNPTSFINDVNPQTIWVRAEYEATNCANVVPLTVFVNANPVLVQPTPMEFCDNDEDGNDTNGFVNSFLLYQKDAEILGGTTGEVVYHENSEDGPIINKLVPYTNLTAGTQAVYAVVTNAETGCSSYVVLDLVVNPLPVAKDLEYIEECDDDSDGFAHFDLSEATEIYNEEEGVEVTYHITEQNAMSGELDLPLNYYSVASTIYVRFENIDTGCFIVKPLNLIVAEKPEIEEIEDLVLCDGNENGQEIFDLTIVRDGILATQPDLIISMYQSEADATNKDNPIDMNSPFVNAIADQQTIWIRIENTGGCFIIESFDLIVNERPSIGDAKDPLIICDDDFDGFNVFDLTVKDTHYLDDQLGMIVTYHTTMLNAETDVTDIPDFTNYVNVIQDAQELYVRVENQTTGCFATSTLTLIVEPLPLVELNPTALEQCDDDMDGVAIFNLQDKEEEILSGQNASGIVFEYYENESLTSEITDINTYITASTTVYIKVENDHTELNCYVVIPLELKVNELPEIDQDEYHFCEIPGFEETTINVSDITLDLFENPSSFEVKYYFTESEAEANSFAQIVNPIVVDPVGTTLYVRIKDLNTGCVNVDSLVVKLGDSPKVSDIPVVYAECGFDGIATFDFTQLNFVTTPSLDEVTITYYESEEDAINMENPISDSNYESTSKMVWANVQSIETSCIAITFIEIVVVETPIFETNDEEVICLVENPENGQIETEISVYNPTGEFVYEWTLNGTVLDANTESILVSEAGTYTVKAIGQDPIKTCESEVHTIEVVASYIANLTADDIVVSGYVDGFGSNTIAINTTSLNLGEYEFSIDEGNTWQTAPVFTDVPGGDYVLLIRNVLGGGCENPMIPFGVIDFPKYFTPNNDGVHDTWGIQGLNNDSVISASIFIYDRYGKLITRIHKNDEGWNGLNEQGNPLPSSDYWFTLEVVKKSGTADGTITTKTYSKKGHFSLIRR